MQLQKTMKKKTSKGSKYSPQSWKKQVVTARWLFWSLILNILHTNLKVPGHPENGQFHSSTLTKRSFTTFKKWNCPSQKFPCFLRSLKPRNIKNDETNPKVDSSARDLVKVTLSLWLSCNNGSILRLMFQWTTRCLLKMSV